MTTQDAAVTAAAEAMHDAYEARAAEVGWETQARSRVAWVDVPEANKQAMYAAVAAARPIIEAEVRERIAAEERAVKHYRVGPARCACGYDAYKVGGFFPDYHAMFMAHLDAAGRIARGQS